MTTESNLMPREAYSIVFRDGERLTGWTLCKEQLCAELSVAPVEGRTVVGVLVGTFLPMEEGVLGLRFAIDRGNAAEAELLTPVWRPDAAHINALPHRVRDHEKQLGQAIHRAGLIGEAAILRDQLTQLQSKHAALAAIARRALPFLEEAGAEFEDDGSNEPLETFRDLTDAVEGVADA